MIFQEQQFWQKPYKHHKTQITSNYYKLIKLYKNKHNYKNSLKTIFLYYFKEMIDILDIASKFIAIIRDMCNAIIWLLIAYVVLYLFT